MKVGLKGGEVLARDHHKNHHICTLGIELDFNLVLDNKTFVLISQVSGSNFYASPKVSNTGMLAWFQWNHPNMVSEQQNR